MGRVRSGWPAAGIAALAAVAIGLSAPGAGARAPGGPDGPAALGARAPRQTVRLVLDLAGRDPAGLARLVDAGRAVSPAAYARRFGPRPREVSTVTRILAGDGLAAAWVPGSPLLTVAGAVEAVERAFDVRLERRRSPTGAAYLVPAGPWRLPPGLGRVVTALVGLDGAPTYHPAGAIWTRVGTDEGSAGPSGLGGFTPDQVRGFYNFDPLYAGGLDGQGQTVVFLEISGYLAGDIAEYSSQFGLPSPDLGPPVTSPAWGSPEAVGSAGWEPEAEMDLEIVHALAPGARLVVYEAGPTPGDLLQALQAAIRSYPQAVFSVSLGACEQAEVARAWSSLFTELASSRGTALVSSGDSGAFICPSAGHAPRPSVSSPADVPDVTAVGGTTAFLGQGDTYGAEAAWGSPVEQVGSGGGLSSVFPRPSWQDVPGVVGPLSDGMRQVPDVSAIGDALTGWDVVAQGRWEVAAGTSAAAPLWAALIALADEALARRGLPAVGFADRALYYLGSVAAKLPARPFHEVVRGDNLYYRAGPGWNFAAGWGSPNASGLVDDFLLYEKAFG